MGLVLNGIVSANVFESNGNFFSQFLTCYLWECGVVSSYLSGGPILGGKKVRELRNGTPSRFQPKSDLLDALPQRVSNPRESISRSKGLMSSGIEDIRKYYRLRLYGLESKMGNLRHEKLLPPNEGPVCFQLKSNLMRVVFLFFCFLKMLWCRLGAHILEVCNGIKL